MCICRAYSQSVVSLHAVDSERLLSPLGLITSQVMRTCRAYFQSVVACTRMGAIKVRGDLGDILIMDISAEKLKISGERMAAVTSLMWVGDLAAPQNLLEAVGSRYRLVNKSLADNFWDASAASSVVLFYPESGGCTVSQVSAMLDKLEAAGAVGLLLTDSEEGEIGSLCGKSGNFAAVDIKKSAENLAGRIDSLTQLQPLLARASGLVSEAESSRQEFSGRIDQMEEEMRMAARLQSDFLPDSMPEIGKSRFSVMFRPAGWVSGDIYEVSRIDEDHVGFYVADAVGHGMPAALLTMFIKRVLPTKAIVSDSYRIIQPAEALAELNEAICEQNLSSCQFCSAFYGILNCRTLELSYCRGGHPEPVLLRPGENMDFLSEGGGLLGIFPESKFAQGTIQLQSGDKLVIYSDGAEDVFRDVCADGRSELLRQLESCRNMDYQLMSLQLAGIFDDHVGSAQQIDDITALIMAIES